MNDTYKEITKLHEHVSQLYMALKELSEYVGWEDIPNLNLPFEVSTQGKTQKSIANNYNNRHPKENLYLVNQHKDILVDDESVRACGYDNPNKHSESISCEEQVHRLTAQLTAAYYRIASLEEQLLAIRSGMETGEDDLYQCQ